MAAGSRLPRSSMEFFLSFLLTTPLSYVTSLTAYQTSSFRGIQVWHNNNYTCTSHTNQGWVTNGSMKITAGIAYIMGVPNKIYAFVCMIGETLLVTCVVYMYAMVCILSMKATCYCNKDTCNCECIKPKNLVNFNLVDGMLWQMFSSFLCRIMITSLFQQVCSLQWDLK